MISLLAARFLVRGVVLEAIFCVVEAESRRGEEHTTHKQKQTDRKRHSFPRAAAKRKSSLESITENTRDSRPGTSSRKCRPKHGNFRVLLCVFFVVCFVLLLNSPK